LRSPGKHESQDPAVLTFISKIETILKNSAASRHSIGNVLVAGFTCKITPAEAHDRMDQVVKDRRRVLGQVSSATGRPAEADRAVTLLETALNYSIEADIDYRNGFRFATGCPPTSDYFKGAAKADTLATKAKTRFVSAFNPLAMRFGFKTWSAGEI
jgi:hypothetical protein